MTDAEFYKTINRRMWGYRAVALPFMAVVVGLLSLLVRCAFVVRNEFAFGAIVFAVWAYGSGRLFMAMLAQGDDSVDEAIRKHKASKATRE